MIRSPRLLLLTMTALAFNTDATPAATIAECQELLRIGEYQQCLDFATDAIQRRSYGEEWPLLKIQAEKAVGQYEQALQTSVDGLSRYSWSVRLRMEAHDCYQRSGEQELSRQTLAEIDRMVSAAPWRYTDADDLVALGNAAIALGADPKDVLEGFFDRARRNYATRPDGSLASGRLALQKGDFALAAEILTPAAQDFADNPDVLFALSEAVRSADAERSAELLQAVLEINPNHADALLRICDQRIDAEDYDAAEELLQRVLSFNPWHPIAHAQQAVIHHLLNRPIDEARSRSLALAFSPKSPEVDHQIGERLSRKYRFAEGAAYQQQALQRDPNHLPSRIQLSQDLLRLGQEDAGWTLAEAAHEQDGYSTTVFNLLQLKDSLHRFATLENDRFVVRMNADEAAVYGDRVLQLLNEVHAEMTARYGYTPAEKTVVEIFDRPADFAVRTFGIPDVAGFLGVCFGKVITANSPTSQRGSPTNWESVLWHEFCHVITLQMTGNRIPRWLSEGISVYEERRKDGRWGQSMSHEFRDRILEGNITPVSELSSAFLNAESGEDLNFAYYESSMVVEFLVQQFGTETLTGILSDLSNGMLINDSLERRADGLAELDAAFDDYLTELARSFAPDVEFDFEVTELTADELKLAASTNPRNYFLGMSLAAQQLREKEYSDAEQNLQRLIELFPEDAGSGSARRLLAELYRRTDRVQEQASLLKQHLEVSGDDLDAAMQLLAIQTKQEDWPAAVATGRLLMSIDPMQPVALRLIATAASASDDRDMALRCLQGLLSLEPADAPKTHFQMAGLLRQNEPQLARRHILLALEQAPRYREAHRMLLELTDREMEFPGNSKR
ncbi:MAG: peptidase MA family metallohydrolase [Planctomycetaceae bacterium]